MMPTFTHLDSLLESGVSPWELDHVSWCSDNWFFQVFELKAEVRVVALDSEPHHGFCFLPDVVSFRHIGSKILNKVMGRSLDLAVHCTVEVT